MTTALETLLLHAYNLHSYIICRFFIYKFIIIFVNNNYLTENAMELIILLRLCTVLTLMSFALINFTLSAPIRYKHNNTKTAYENHNEKTIEKQHGLLPIK